MRCDQDTRSHDSKAPLLLVFWNAAVALSTIGAVAVTADTLPGPAYRYGYYLFMDRGDNCEPCSVPLLMTAEPLEKIAKREGLPGIPLRIAALSTFITLRSFRGGGNPFLGSLIGQSAQHASYYH